MLTVQMTYEQFSIACKSERKLQNFDREISNMSNESIRNSFGRAAPLYVRTRSALRFPTNSATFVENGLGIRQHLAGENRTTQTNTRIRSFSEIPDPDSSHSSHWTARFRFNADDDALYIAGLLMKTLGTYRAVFCGSRQLSAARHVIFASSACGMAKRPAASRVTLQDSAHPLIVDSAIPNVTNKRTDGRTNDLFAIYHRSHSIYALNHPHCISFCLRRRPHRPGDIAACS
jgi:hypothetical protein